MRTHLAIAATALTLLGAQALAQSEVPSDGFKGAARDAWLTGKVEMAFALNSELNPFAIDTSIENGVARLTGMVESDIDRDLAGEVAKSIEGVTMVKNELKVDAMQHATSSRGRSASDEHRDFPTWFDDATTTAAVKSKLIANANTKGLQIDVDTAEDVVTLSGTVSSEEQRQLAEQLARNTGDVKAVRNHLVVDDSS